MQITGGKGAKLIFDPIAGATLDTLATSLQKVESGPNILKFKRVC